MFSIRTLSKLSVLLLLVAILSGCVTTGNSMALEQPSNIGDLKQRLVIYKDKGAYDRDLDKVFEEANKFIERRAKQVSKPVLILDIDETALSNWPALLANDFASFPDAPCDNLPKGPCGMKAWQLSAQAAPIKQTLNLFKTAHAAGVSIFFITGRDESLREATAENLKKAGYDHWEGLIMRPAGTTTPSATDYKAPEREKISKLGYTIIANIGDQPSDLAHGYAEHPFLVPNPFYRIP